MNPEDFIPDDATWFWWPVTFAVAVTAMAVEVVGAGRARGATRARRGALGGAVVLSAAIPVVPLTIGLGAGCSDTGLGPSMNLYGLLAGVPALVAWTAIAWRLYLAAGGDPANAERYPLLLFFGVLAGMVLEFPFSMSSMETYCQGSWAGGRTHLLVAGVSALLTWALVSRPRVASGP